MRKHLIAATLTTVALFSPVSVASAATPQQMSPSTTQTVSARNVWYTYYYNYFYTEQSCNNRGYAMTTPGHPGYIPGLMNWFCYYTGPKWSMDVYAS